MVKRPEVLAIVQARGGSKGLPGKNVRPLHGHPLVAYSVASAVAARAVTRTVISTDDGAIAEIARRYGAEVPFLRPAELAADDTPDFPLFEHALRTLRERENYVPDVVVQLRPTSPFRRRGLVDDAVTLLLGDPAADCVRGVVVSGQNPYKMWRAGGDGSLVPLMTTEFAEPYNMPRQKLPTSYWQTGHIDAIRATTITEKRSLTGRRVLPIMIDADYLVDIDTPADFELAEQALQRKRLAIDVPGGGGVAGEQRDWPHPIAWIVFDFDGVMTDNRVLVLDDGREAVVCNRGDGMGLSLLRKRGFDVAVLSTETNPVVAARCRKLGLPCIHGQDDKAAALRRWAAEKNVSLQNTVYVGNDVNDLGAMDLVGYVVAPSDAHGTVLQRADLTLSRPGGAGAVREFCDLVLQLLQKEREHA